MISPLNINHCANEDLYLLDLYICRKINQIISVLEAIEERVFARHMCLEAFDEWKKIVDAINNDKDWRLANESDR